MTQLAEKASAGLPGDMRRAMQEAPRGEPDTLSRLGACGSLRPLSADEHHRPAIASTFAVSRHGLGGPFARCDVDRVPLGVQVIHLRSSFCFDVQRAKLAIPTSAIAGRVEDERETDL
jgi:hypothetical protein